MSSSSSCPLIVSNINIAAAIAMIFVPLAIAAVVFFFPSVRRHAEWVSCQKMADTLYIVIFLYSILEVGRWDQVQCVAVNEDGDDLSIRPFRCDELACEVLYLMDSTSGRPRSSVANVLGESAGSSSLLDPDCAMCKGHFETAEIMKPFLWVAPVASILVTMTQHKTATVPLFRLYQATHIVNVILWYSLAFTIKFYRCHCKWIGTVDLTVGAFGPLVAVLLVFTCAPEYNWKAKQSMPQQLQRPRETNLDAQQLTSLSSELPLQPPPSLLQQQWSAQHHVD